MANMLFLCSRVPYPLTGGARIRMYNTAKALQRSHSVDLVIIGEEPVDETAITHLDGIFDGCFTFRYPTYRFWMNAVRGIASTKPLQTFYYDFGAIREFLDGRLESYDLVFCNHIRTTEYALDSPTPVVTDFVDAMSRSYRAIAEARGQPWRTLYRLEAHRLAGYERRVVQESTHSLITCEEDKREVVSDSVEPSTVSVLPNGVKPELLEREPAADPGAADLVFLGKMDYFPNRAAVKYVVGEVLPALRERGYDPTFDVVGANPPTDVRRLQRESGVRVTGFVEDPYAFLEHADVVLVPVRIGGGIQNKVLESMALGRPVVTTPLGADGLEVEDGVHLCLGEDADSLSDITASLLDDRTKRQSLGASAAGLVRSRYTWERVGADVRGVVADQLSP